MNESEIEIRLPSKIHQQLRSVRGLSDIIKMRIADKLKSGEIILQPINKEYGVIDANNKCNIILEILQDRAQFDRHITREEILDIIDNEKMFNMFMIKLLKVARERDLIIKKIKRYGKPCYKLA